MDRRAWLQLISILSAARAGYAQQHPAGAGRGSAPPAPMRVTRDQVAAALKLMGVEFPDDEMEMMLRGVNQALGNYENLRKVDIPLDTEPAFSFRPGLPDRQPIKGPPRFETTISKPAKLKPPADLEELAFWRVTELAPLVRS